MNCPRCSRPIEANELTWPSAKGAGTYDICQDCWEDQCDREWWLRLNLQDVLEEAGKSDAEATERLQSIMDAWADKHL